MTLLTFAFCPFMSSIFVISDTIISVLTVSPFVFEMANLHILKTMKFCQQIFIFWSPYECDLLISSVAPP